MKTNVGSLENVDISPRSFEYVDFEVEKEIWNKYKLEDGAILKTKFVLINILAQKGIGEVIKKLHMEKSTLELNFSLQSSNVLGVEVPTALLGDPSKVKYSPMELAESIIDDDLDIEAISESQNRYRLNFEKVGEVAYLRIKSSPIKVSRTSKFDEYGVPQYIVNFSVSMRMSSK